MRKFGFLAVPLLASLSHAEVPVDEKPLSGAAQTRPVAASQPLQSQSMDNAPSVQWDLYQQVQQLQQEIRQLRGQLEVQSNQIERLKQDARSRYLDLDQRITQLGVKVATPPAAVATDTATPQPAAVSPAPEAVKPAPTVEDEKRAYFAAYEVFRSGGPNKAINPMRDFIKTFPQSTYIPGAYYWLGEFYLAASPADVNNARKSFRILVEQFPDAPKVPSALLKLASLADVDGKTADAARYLGDILKRFPSSAEAASAKQWLKDHNLPIPKPEGKSKTADDTKPAAKPSAPAPSAKPDGKAKDSSPAAKPADKSEKPKAAH